jgi:hypothetical protein
MRRFILAGLLMFVACRPATAAEPLWAVGGAGPAGSFTYGGEGAGACSDDVCRGGTCTGTTPNGTCTLDFNSYLLKGSGDAGNAFVSAVHQYIDFTMTAGTLTIGSPGTEGSALVLRVQDAASITGGTITVKGKGGVGATSGSCASSNAGKSGGNTSLFAGGSAGTSSGTDGSPGTGAGAMALRDMPVFGWFGGAGAGGGACPVSGQSSAGSPVTWRSIGGSGGGGGGCAASCSGTCGAGGRGGGYLRIEVGGSLVFGASATLDATGDNGAAGGGGGGGGGVIQLIAQAASVNGLVLVGGGSPGGTPPTNCGAGAAGGTGAYFVNGVGL